MPETILNSEVQLGWCKNAVKDVFELCAVDVGELVARYNFDIREEVRRIIGGVGDTSLDLASGNPSC